MPSLFIECRLQSLNGVEHRRRKDFHSVSEHLSGCYWLEPNLSARGAGEPRLAAATS